MQKPIYSKDINAHSHLPRRAQLRRPKELEQAGLPMVGAAEVGNLFSESDPRPHLGCKADLNLSPSQRERQKQHCFRGLPRLWRARDISSDTSWETSFNASLTLQRLKHCMTRVIPVKLKAEVLKKALTSCTFNNSSLNQARLSSTDDLAQKLSLTP
ncbi:hypothetical protein P7K49_029329 [Saguinus oedipus]|uniref:Uncharacterized protein n=1 Tax=Saguinus oedipus TaxID=9490 RepID=A0ABQ9U7R8_SAGOE|nr:hypothetical protein P7K49_029329 [Saguinus oedipus]